MKLSEIEINPIWDNNKRTYINEPLEEEIISQIVFSGIEDNGLKSTYAICMGTSRKIEMAARVEKAVELYKSGRIKKVLFTGGKQGITSTKKNQTPKEVKEENESISYIIDDDLSEAERMNNFALKLGINKEDIILDTISNNSNETLKNLNQFIPLKENENLILISSKYHLKRCLASAQKYIPLHLNYSLVAAPTGYFEEENYKNTSLGKTIINFEANHLIRLAREDKIEDLEIEEGLTRK